MPSIKIDIVLHKLVTSFTYTGNSVKTSQLITWSNVWAAGLHKSRAFFTGDMGLWSAPLMVSSTTLSLYLSWLMHARDITTTEAQALAAYAQNGFYFVEICEEEGAANKEAQQQPEKFRKSQSTPTETTASIKPIHSTLSDIESQRLQSIILQKDVAQDFVRGTAIMTLNTTSLIILAISINASTPCLSFSPASLLTNWLLWYTYAIICIIASFGAGCWLKQLRNLGGKTRMKNIPTGIDIIAQAAGAVLECATKVMENVITGVFVGLGAVVVLLWWSVWNTWGVGKAIFGCA